MNPKITDDHRQRGAVVYIRQSSLAQVHDHTESQRRQYALAETARGLGFATVETIDEDLGRSGSGQVERPGFQRLVAAVCAGAVGAVLCLEASRLARNGRDWHHLIDLCALVGTLVIDLDGVYDPRLINDRLLLGLKGTMSEYELSLLRQRGLAARDAKARRGMLRFGLPPGYCWDEGGRIVKDPDVRVVEAIELVFRKFVELGSVRQVLLWFLDAQLTLPVVQQGHVGAHLVWRAPAYHTVLSIVRSPIYAGAYAFGRTQTRTHVIDGRARISSGHRRAREDWPVLLRDHHPGYIPWEQYERHQTMLAENAHMQKRTSRKSGRGGHALLTGMVRCGRCGRMLHVLYGMKSGHAHRYLCVGDDFHGGNRRCVGIGGVRVDRAVGAALLAAVAPHAVQAALDAAAHVEREHEEVRRAVARELEEARYEADLAARRHEAVDPARRLVAAELEARWEAALERVHAVERRLAVVDAARAEAPPVDRAALLALAANLPRVWDAPTTDPQARQRLVHTLIREVIIDLDDRAHVAVVTIHWSGGRHTECRIPRVRTGRCPGPFAADPLEVVRTLGGRCTDRELAVTMNRMRCRREDGATWTELRVRALREQLAIAAFDPRAPREAVVSMDVAALRLGICVSSVQRLIREGVLPATQLLPMAPWQIPVAALESEAVRRGVEAIIARRPHKPPRQQLDTHHPRAHN